MASTRFRHALVLASLLLPIATADAVDPATYDVSATLRHSGSVFAEPRLRLRPGVPARIEVAGPDGYSLGLQILETNPDALDVEARLDSMHGSMSPTLVVRPGQPASISIGELQLDITVQEAHP